MRHTVATAQQSDPHVSLDSIRPTPAKATLPQSDLVRSSDLTLGEVALEALVAHYGSLKVLTIEAGETDPSFVKREILAGKFNRIAKCGPEAFAAVGVATSEAFGPNSPTGETRRAIRQIIKALTVIEQFVDYVDERRSA